MAGRSANGTASAMGSGSSHADSVARRAAVMLGHQRRSTRATVSSIPAIVPVASRLRDATRLVVGSKPIVAARFSTLTARSICPGS